MAVLVLTNKRDLSSDEVIRCLDRLGLPVFRLNTEDLCCGANFTFSTRGGSLSLRLSTSKRSVDLSEIGAIFSRRPTPPRHPSVRDRSQDYFIWRERDAFLSWLWIELSGKYWLNHPLNTRVAEAKVHQLRLAYECGFITPPTLITNERRSILSFADEFDGKVINKTLCGTLIDVDGRTHTVYTHRISDDDLADLPEFESVPCFLQERIEKAFEIRATVVGDEIYAAAIDSQGSVRTQDDWRRYDFENAKYRVYELPPDIRDKCLLMMRRYSLDYGAFDLAVTPAGDHVFFEMNPNGQWLWVEKLTGLPISEAIASRLAACHILTAS